MNMNLKMTLALPTVPGLASRRAQTRFAKPTLPAPPARNSPPKTRFSPLPCWFLRPALWRAFSGCGARRKSLTPNPPLSASNPQTFMKTFNATLKTLLVAALPLLLFAALARAEDKTNAAGWTAKETTNAPQGMVIQKGDRKITTSGELGDTPFSLPKEILEQLSPEQIVELEKTRRQPSQITDILGLIGFFGVPVAIVALVVMLRLKRNKMLHETMRAMIDKGQPIPPALLQPHEPKRRPKSDLRRGLVLAGIGVGLTVWLALDGGNQWALGLIPLLMGLGFLVTWKVEHNKNGDSK